MNLETIQIILSLNDQRKAAEEEIKSLEYMCNRMWLEIPSPLNKEITIDHIKSLFVAQNKKAIADLDFINQKIAEF
jgi:hypothetical protein